MNRLQFKQELRKLIQDDPTMSEGYDFEIIYQIDDIKIYGQFDYGLRGLDHNILKSDNVTWEQILRWGTVVVPETMTYISENEIETFEQLSYSRLGLDKNHIMGGQ